MGGLEVLLGGLISGLIGGGATMAAAGGAAQASKEAEERDVMRSMAEKGLAAGQKGIEASQDLTNQAFQQLMGSYRGLME